MKHIYNLLLLSFLLFNFSCKNEISNQDDLNVEASDAKVITKDINDKVDPEYNVQNGMLHFSSMEAMYSTANYLNSMSIDDLLKWSEKYSFNTQKTLFEKTVIEENKLSDKYAELSEKDVSENELQLLLNNQMHSDIYKECINKGVIKEIVDESGTRYDYAVCDPVMVSILNEDGFFAVQNDIYYFDGQYIKKWENGNISHLDEIKLATKSDEQKGIQILYETKPNALLRSSLGAGYTPPVISSNEIVNGSSNEYRYRLQINCGVFIRMLFCQTCREVQSVGYKYYVHISSEKKKKILGIWLNAWEYRTVDVNYSGNWSTTVNGQVYGGLQNMSNTGNFSASYTVSSGNNVFLGISLWGNGIFYYDNEQYLSMTINGKPANLLTVNMYYNHYANLGNNTIHLKVLNQAFSWKNPSYY